MKVQLCLILAVVVSASAHGQYRRVGGNVVPINSRDWTIFRGPIEVIRLGSGTLYCRSFTEEDVTVGSSVVPGQRLRPGSIRAPITTPITQRRKTYQGDMFELTNYPGALSLKRADVIQSSIKGMRINAPITTRRADGSTVTSDHYLYDYGVDYVLPQRPLTPEEAAALKAQTVKQNAAKEVTILKFDQEQADKGKDLYQYRMGMRYLKGNGVTNDLHTAQEYFTKAAAQGNQDAAAELRKLSSQ